MIIGTRHSHCSCVRKPSWAIGLVVVAGCWGSAGDGGGAQLGFVMEVVQTQPPTVTGACLSAPPEVDAATGRARCALTGRAADGSFALEAADWTYDPPEQSADCPATGAVRFADGVVPPGATVRIECVAE